MRNVTKQYLEWAFEHAEGPTRHTVLEEHSARFSGLDIEATVTKFPAFRFDGAV
jgi:hypothetical protein